MALLVFTLALTRTASGAFMHAFVQTGSATKILGTLGGSQSFANDINDSGQVIGYSLNSGGFVRAFVWQGHALIDLGALTGTTDCYAQAINDAGQVTGTCTDNGSLPRAFIWANGVMMDIGSGIAEDINDSGQVIGRYTGEGFLWENGVRTALNFQPFGMNNVGVIVGGNGLGQVWQNGSVTTIGPLPGNTKSWAEAVNDVGEVVGVSHSPGNDRAYIRQSGVISSIGLDIANGINESGQVVGSRNRHAALLQNGSTVDLGLGFDSHATAINDLGQIVGWAPVPEPSSLLLAVGGLCCFTLLHFVRIRPRTANPSS